MGLGVVQEWVDGIPVDLRRFLGGKPWELVAQVAAAVHAIDPAPMRDWLPGYPTWQDHALGFASPLQDLEEPEAEDTRAWVREHLPAPIASCLLHGDLLGQNLRQLYELILVAGFYVALVGNYGKGSPHAEQQRHVWQSVLRRASTVDRE
jgi:hypothetical protein